MKKRTGFVLDRAPLLTVYLAELEVEATLQGGSGTIQTGFYNPRNVLQALEKMGGGNSTSSFDVANRSNSSGSVGDHDASRRTASAGVCPVTSGPEQSPTQSSQQFTFLAGRYFTVGLQGLNINLRNFRRPLFQMGELELSGSALAAQVAPHVRGAPSGSGADVRAAEPQPLGSSSTSSAFLSALKLSLKRPTTESLSGHLTREKWTPIQLFFELEGRSDQVCEVLLYF